MGCVLQRKTKKLLLINFLAFVAGLAMFLLSIRFGTNLIGVIGFCTLFYSGFGVLDYLVKGLIETIEFKRYWQERDLGSSKESSFNFEYNLNKSKEMSTEHINKNTHNKNFFDKSKDDNNFSL